MNRKLTLPFLGLIFFMCYLPWNNINAQGSIASDGGMVTISFDASTSGILNGSFDASDISGSPSAGDLDSDGVDIDDDIPGAIDVAAVFGTNDVNFRGTSNGSVGAGGIYAFDVMPGAGTNRALGFQPTGSQWGDKNADDGQIVFRFVNNSGGTLTAFRVMYEIYTHNNENRNSVIESYLTTDVSTPTYGAVRHTHTTPAGEDITPTWVNEASVDYSVITGVNVPNGGSIYLRFYIFDGNAPSGTRDEFAIDDIKIIGASTPAGLNVCVDAAPPTITCPGDQTRPADANCTYSPESFIGMATTTDDCDPPNAVTVTQFVIFSSGIGNNLVTLTATDGASNTATCTFFLIVEDQTPPTALCQNATVNVGEVLMPGSVDNGSSDNCDNSPGLSVSPNTFTCGNIATAPSVTLTVSDNAGNSTTCVATVTVQDNGAPTAVCQNFTLGMSNTLTAANVDGGSSTPCGSFSSAVLPTSFACADVGPNTVTLTITDDSNSQTSTCTAVVTVEDDVPPTAVCQNATINVGEVLMPGSVDNGSSDNCDNPPNLSVSPNTFTCGNIGTPPSVTLTVSDNAGNSTVCVAAVTVQEGPPTAVCQDFTLDLSNPVSTSLSASSVDGGSSTPCGGFSSAVSPNSFTCNDIGPHTVTLTITDNNTGQSSTCTATVTVEDTNAVCCQAPVAMCADQTVSLDTGGNGSVTTAQVGAGSTADCGLQSETVVPSAFDCDDIGPNTVTYTITDINGASATCTAVVTVEDNEAPTAACFNPTVEFNGEAEIFLTFDQVWDEGSSSDNCDLPTLVDFLPASVTCDQLGMVIPVTVTIEDASGNPGQCIANVTVGGLPCGWSAGPDGINCPNGSEASYDPNTDIFDVSSEGCYDPNYYSDTDLHGYVGTQLCGDGEIIAHVTQVSGSGFAGVSMRESLAPGAKMLQLSVDGVFLTKRELRQSTGGLAFNHLFQTLGKNWLRLTRSGNIFSAQHSDDGINWAPVIIVNIAMTSCIEIGLFTENSSPTGVVSGTFEDVSIKTGGGVPLSTPDVNLDVADVEVNAEITIFPNPTRGEVSVDLGGYIGQKATIEVYNSLGQALELMEIDEIQIPTQRLDLSEHQSGLYFIKIKIPGVSEVTRKLMLAGDR